MTDGFLPSAESIARGGAWRLVASIAPQAYVAVVSIVAARVLGPEGMGRQSFIAFVLATTTLLLTGGLAASLMRHVAELVGRGDRPAIAALVSWAARRQLVAASVAMAILGLTGVARGDLVTAWVFAAVAGGFAVLHSVPNAVVVGSQRWRQHSVAALLIGAVGAAATVAVLLAGGGISGMFAVEAGVALIGLGVMAHLARRSVPGVELAGGAPDAELQRRVRVYARGALLQLVLHVIVWRRTELFLLERWASPAALAHYSIAFSMLMVLIRIPGALTTTLSPAFATLKGAAAPERIASGFARAVRLLLLAALPLTAAVLAAGPRLLVTAYGGEYRPAVAPLLIMACAFPLVALHQIGVSVLQGVGEVRPLVVAGAVATAVDLALAVALIPAHGARGAAVANLGAQVSAAALTFWFARRAVGGRVQVEGRALVGTAAASALAGAAAYAAVSAVEGAAGLPAAAVAGVLTFLVAARVIGVVARDDADWLLSRMNGPAGRVVAGMAERFST